jgi:hypothetical protein
MADRGRGGNQPPRNPAAVSNPGSGRRTDGGAGSKSAPLRVPSGGAYGARKATEAQQSGAPLAAGGGQPPSGGGMGGPSAGGGAPPTGGGAFGPTQRPHESPSQQVTNNPVAQNPQEALRVMYSRFPHPAIKRLLDMSNYGSRPPR